MSERARSSTLPHPRATSLSMLDGAVAAVVAGPVSMAPEEWMCPLLGVDPDDFNHDTEAFSAIAATLMRHNAISETLSTRPESFEPLFVPAPNGKVDPQPWCMGFYAVMKLRLLVWSRLLSPDRADHALLRPILIHCGDDAGRPALSPATRSPGTPPRATRLPRHSRNRRGPPQVLDADALQARRVAAPPGAGVFSYRLRLIDLTLAICSNLLLPMAIQTAGMAFARFMSRWMSPMRIVMTPNPLALAGTT